MAWPPESGQSAVDQPRRQRHAGGMFVEGVPQILGALIEGRETAGVELRGLLGGQPQGVAQFVGVEVACQDTEDRPALIVLEGVQSLLDGAGTGREVGNVVGGQNDARRDRDRCDVGAARGNGGGQRPEARDDGDLGADGLATAVKREVEDRGDDSPEDLFEGVLVTRPSKLERVWLCVLVAHRLVGRYELKSSRYSGTTSAQKAFMPSTVLLWSTMSRITPKGIVATSAPTRAHSRT